MSNHDLVPGGATALTLQADQERFTDGQLAALTALGVEKASPADLDVFFHQCRRTGLDPFARQIYMIARNVKTSVRDPQTGAWVARWVVKQTIQTGIDGFRLVARRAADARGETFSMDDTLWCDPKGGWHEAWIWPDVPPAAAKVTVRLGDAQFSGVATMHEYAQKDKTGNPVKQWRTMPAHMLAKCAESLALRKAFPLDLSGLYTAEEMQQADNPQPEPPQQQAAPARQQEPAPAQEPAPQQQAAPPQDPGVEDAEIVEDTLVDQVKHLVTEVRLTPGDALAGARHYAGNPALQSLDDLTDDEAARVITALQAHRDKQAAARGTGHAA